MKEIVEVRVYSKFGGMDELYTVSLIFSDGTCAHYEKQPLMKLSEAESFALGVREGLALAAQGYSIKQ